MQLEVLRGFKDSVSLLSQITKCGILEAIDVKERQFDINDDLAYFNEDNIDNMNIVDMLELMFHKYKGPNEPFIVAMLPTIVILLYFRA